MSENIVLYGAGNDAERVYESYHLKRNIVAVIDGNKKGFWKNIPVISLEDYKNKYNNFEIVISSSKYAKEIKEILRESGIYHFTVPDIFFVKSDVPHDEDIAHENWINYLVKLCDKPGAEILEVGSRVVTGSCFRDNFKYANYTGFDYYQGENVDVVGDTHQLSKYFDKKFDLIFSSAVFEHLAMPWIASLEMIKLLKPNGYIFVETHYSYSSHERPWHFFQFSENALNVLFPEIFGIKCIKKGCSNVLRAEFSNVSSEYLQGKLVNGLYCHSEFLGQKVHEVGSDFSWDNIKLEDVVGESKYPNPNRK